MAQPSLPIYDGFDYANNERIGAGTSSTNWFTALNSTGTGSALVSNQAALTYPGLPTSTGLGLWFTPTPPSSGRNRGYPIQPVSLSAAGSTVYYSFLLNVQANPSGLKQIFALSSSTNSLATPMTTFLTADGRLALGKNSSTAATVTNSTPLTSGTHLVVVRIKSVSGTSNDELALWIDPGSLGVGEGSVPGVTITTTSGSDQSQVGLIAVVAQTTPNPPGNFYVDELRMGTTWASVTPSGCTPGTAFNVTGGGSFCTGDPGVSVGLSGSETGVDYRLKLAGNDVGSPLPGTGSALDFGLQSSPGIYTVLASNLTTSCVGLMSSNAVVSSNSAPVVTTSPTPALGTNSVGGSRVYTVVATNGSFTYQWRLNGTNLSNGGNISGATSATLTINPVALTNTGDYDCVVSGTCSPSATSAAANLFVKLPATLTWVGDGTANLWDTTTPNWTGDNTLFETGDIVTFNDSGSNNIPIDLVGVIAPLSITVNASQDYTIGSTTGGSLGGAATISKSGSGTLTLTSTNSHTGKASVTGGTLSIALGANLGAAPVSFTPDQLTLDGGALRVTASGSINANRGTTLGASGGTIDVTTSVLFTNTPIITGAGGLTKIGNGTLGLPAANTYLGGTTLSNGTITVDNNAALGTGDLTLAGGTLSFPAARTIVNNVNVSSSSTITFGTTGNSAVVLNGDLTGAGGTTLTITPTGAATTGTRVRLGSGITNTFTCNSDIILNGTFTFATYNHQGTQAFNGIISGAGTLGRRSTLAGTAGVTILNGNNTYSGGTVMADGAIGFGLDSTGSPTVTSGPIGTGMLTFESNASTLQRLIALGGPRTIGNAIAWSSSGTAMNVVIEGSNPLTLAGNVDLGANIRSINSSNSARTTLSGILSSGGLIKDGPGELLLNGINTYIGQTTVSNGTLGGTGTIAGPVLVTSGGNLAPGASIGTLTVTSNLTLNGNFSVEVDSASGPNADLVTGLNTVTYGGTLTVANLGPALTTTDTFQLFSATTYQGAFASISPATPGAGLLWNTNTLTTDGILRVASESSAPAATNITFTKISGSEVVLDWPAGQGWKLQAQTNTLSIGLTTNWVEVTGATPPYTNTISPTDPAVFHRLVYP